MFIFHSDSPVVKKYYTQDRNYKIIPGHKENKYVVIYFSSNDIYYPNNRRTFEKRIIKEDRYEWKKNLLPNTRKHIFVRDIHKQWYLYGISKDII